MKKKMKLGFLYNYMNSSIIRMNYESEGRISNSHHDMAVLMICFFHFIACIIYKMKINFAKI